MKKFGKIFGIAAVAVATLTAGVVGLSGCGNKWKNSDDYKAPEDPIDPPVAEERPLISVVSMDAASAYLNDANVKSTFDGVKIVASIEGVENAEDCIALEFAALKNTDTVSGKAMMKQSFKNGTSETYYITSDERAVFVKSEAQTETGTDVKKEKLVEGERMDGILAEMQGAMDNTMDVKAQFTASVEAFAREKMTKLVCVKTVLGETTEFEVIFDYDTTENVDGGETSVDVNYTGSYSLGFESGVIRSYDSETTRTEKASGKVMKSTSSAMVVEDFDLPTDLDTYVAENDISAEAALAYMQGEGVISEITEIAVNIVENDKTTGADVNSAWLKAVKANEKFKAAGVNVVAEDNKSYYYSNENDIAWIVEGEVNTKIDDAVEVTSIANTFTEAYNQYSSAVAMFSGYMDAKASAVEETSTIKKKMYGKTVEILVNSSYKMLDEGTGEQNQYILTIKLVYENDCIRNYEFSMDDGKTLATIEVGILDSFEFPNFETGVA